MSIQMSPLILSAIISLSATGGHVAAPSQSAPVCGAPLPPAGARFDGVVLHVFDGQTFCIAQGATPSDWVRVTLSEGSPLDSRSLLMAVVFGKRLVCVADDVTQDGVVARCKVGDVGVRAAMDDPAARLEAASWR